MIDYTKILLTGIDVVRLSEILDFKFEVVENTSEIITPKKSIDYHFCKITVYDNGLVLFTGSIHKLYNSINGIIAPNYSPNSYGGFNGNSFTYENIVEVRTHLTELFDCQPQQMVFQNIEFGINTTPIFNPQSFIKGLLFHNGKSFEYRFNECFAQVEHKRYYIKIYNKSTQYSMKENTLRFELKIIKTEELKKTSIRTFADITPVTLNNVKELILKRLNEVVYYDYTIRTKKLTNRQKQSLKEYSNPRFWLHKLNSNHRDRHKKKLHFIIKNNSDNLKEKIKENIIEKCVIINRTFLDPKCVIINSSNIGLNITQKGFQKLTKKTQEKRCLITGIKLTCEDDEKAKYIRTKTLRYLRENNIDLFESLVSEYLGGTKTPKYEKSLISHLAKQIRNKYYNSKKIKSVGYKKKNYKNTFQFRLVV